MIRTIRLAVSCLLLLGAAATVAAGELGPVPKVGELPPQLLGKDRKGQPVDLSTQRGKIAIVTFWASWCGPCRKELPVLGQLQAIVGTDDLQVFAVNFKEPRNDFLNVTRDRKAPPLTWVHDGKGVVSDQYGIQAIPHMFILDHDGRVAHVHRGYSEEALPKILEEIMALLPEEVRNRPHSAP